MVKFHANAVAVEDMEDDFWLVGFAADEFNTEQYLMLQRSHEDTEQDVELGMNTYYVERDDQGNSGYGGIEQFDLHPNRVRVTFNETGRRTMGVEEMEITFQPDEHQFNALQRFLKQIFAGTNCLRIQPA